jgi:hypothetical protein
MFASDGGCSSRIAGPPLAEGLGEPTRADPPVLRGAVGAIQPGAPRLAARYGHYFQPESIARLCQQHGLTYPV